MTYTDQSPFDARLEWGEAGLRALAPDVASIVIVDVLSFSTAVDVAIGSGATVIPYRWKNESATAFAESRGAFLAVSRRQASTEHPYSLSPESLRQLPDGSAIVLPSPNGATLSSIAAEFDASFFTGCLRNASSVASACREIGGPTLVIAAGERWGDAGAGPLRPAFEDLVGAGALLSALGAGRPSPEATAAIAVFHDSRQTLHERMSNCASGRELITIGFRRDVEIAAELDVSTAVPQLRDDMFTGWSV